MDVEEFFNALIHSEHPRRHEAIKLIDSTSRHRLSMAFFIIQNNEARLAGEGHPECMEEALIHVGEKMPEIVKKEKGGCDENN